MHVQPHTTYICTVLSDRFEEANGLSTIRRHMLTTVCQYGLTTQVDDTGCDDTG